MLKVNFILIAILEKLFNLYGIRHIMNCKQRNFIFYQTTQYEPVLCLDFGILEPSFFTLRGANDGRAPELSLPLLERRILKYKIAVIRHYKELSNIYIHSIDPNPLM